MAAAWGKRHMHGMHSMAGRVGEGRVVGGERGGMVVGAEGGDRGAQSQQNGAMPACLVGLAGKNGRVMRHIRHGPTRQAAGRQQRRCPIMHEMAETDVASPGPNLEETNERSTPARVRPGVPKTSHFCHAF